MSLFRILLRHTMKNEFYSEGNRVFIVLNKGCIAVIDRADFEIVDALPNSWVVNEHIRNGRTLRYAIMTVEKTTVYMHRHLLRLSKGDPEIVDHRDFDGLNNTRENIRIVDYNANNERRAVTERMDPLPRNIYKNGTNYCVKVEYRNQRFQYQSKNIAELVALRDVVRAYWGMTSAHTLPHPYETATKP